MTKRRVYYLSIMAFITSLAYTAAELDKCTSPEANKSEAIVNLPVKAFTEGGYRGSQGEVVCSVKVKYKCGMTMKNTCGTCNYHLCPKCSRSVSKRCATGCNRCWLKDGSYLPDKKDKYQFNVSLDFIYINNTKYYNFSLIIRDIDYNDGGKYNCDVSTTNDDPSVYHNSNVVDFQVKDPVINCLNMTLASKIFNGRVTLSCQIFGEPSSKIVLHWYRIINKNKTYITQKDEVHSTYWSKVSSITIVQPDEDEEIACEAKNELLHTANGTCYRYQTIDGKNKVWTIVSVVTGLGALLLTIIVVILKRRKVIPWIYLMIYDAEVLILWTQPFLMKDMKSFSERIGHDLQLRTLEITNLTKWINMQMVYENLKRYKIVVCLINEVILPRSVKKPQYKDHIREIICRCQREENVINTPPLLVIKSNRLNRSQYPDQIDQLECIDCDDSLSQDQLDQLVESVTLFYRNNWDDFAVLQDDLMDE